jgi:hypothetical protein
MDRQMIDRQIEDRQVETRSSKAALRIRDVTPGRSDSSVKA